MTTESAATPTSGTEALNLTQATTAIEAMLSGPDDEEELNPDEQEQESESDGDEVDKKDEEEEQEAESEEKKEATPEPTYEVTLPGGEKANVPISELVKGYSREADYTKKTTALADQRKQLNDEVEAKSAQKEAYLRNEYVGKLDAIEQLLSGAPDVNWTELEATNPGEFLRLKMKEIERKEALEITQREKHRITQESQAKQQAQYQDYVKTQLDTLMEKAPEFKDPEQGKKMFGEVNKYLIELGYSKDEIANLADHRAILAVRDAIKYRELQNKAKTISDKKVVTVPQVQKPGAARDTSQKQDQNKAYFHQARKTGSTKDAAKYIEQFL